MKFYKRKTDVDGNTTGDFDSFDTEQLKEELIAVLGEQSEPQRWYTNTGETEIEVVILDPDIDEAAVKDVVLAHGSKGENYYKEQGKTGQTKIDLSDLQAATTVADMKSALIEILQKMQSS